MLTAPASPPTLAPIHHQRCPICDSTPKPERTPVPESPRCCALPEQPSPPPTDHVWLCTRWAPGFEQPFSSALQETAGQRNQMVLPKSCDSHRCPSMCPVTTPTRQAGTHGLSSQHGFLPNSDPGGQQKAGVSTSSKIWPLPGHCKYWGVNQ